MKFSRIFATLMLAITLLGTVPAEAGIFDWLADIFIDAPAAQNAAQARRQDREDAPVRQDAPRNRNGRRGRNRRQQRQQQQRPARQRQARTARKNPREEAKRLFKKRAVLIALGLAVGAISTWGLLGPIRNLVDAAKPAQEVNNLVDDIVNVPKDVEALGKKLFGEPKEEQPVID